MSSAAFSTLGSPVSVCVAGVGSYLPEQRVSNRQMLERVDPRHPDGTPFGADWIERHVGINERRLDFDFEAGRKRERSEGGLFDGDLALRAARTAALRQPVCRRLGAGADMRLERLVSRALCRWLEQWRDLYQQHPVSRWRYLHGHRDVPGRQWGAVPSPSFIRPDVQPVLVFETETDIVGHFAARQADSANYRLWEPAGTAHVDCPSQ